MRVEMREGERELLVQMLKGPVTPACAKLFYRVREKLLLTGHSYDMPKETLALIAVLAEAVETAPAKEELEPSYRETVEIERPDPTPEDEITENEKDILEQQQASLDGEATGGAYKGQRKEWKVEFQSTVDTPVHLLERNRPICYKSPYDGRERSGKFLRMSRKNRLAAWILSSEKKKEFEVPVQNITPTDLTPPSPEPRAVQI